jgi:hypothetical protein
MMQNLFLMHCDIPLFELVFKIWCKLVTGEDPEQQELFALQF